LVVYVVCYVLLGELLCGVWVDVCMVVKGWCWGWW